MTYLAESVGPSASLAKLVGKSGFPGPRSPTTLYTSLLALDAWLHRLLPKLPTLLIELRLGGEGYSSGVLDCCCCCCCCCCWSWLTDDVDDVRSRRAGEDVVSAAKIPGTVGTVEMRRPWM